MRPYALQVHNELWLSIASLCYYMASELGENHLCQALSIYCLTNQPYMSCNNHA
jgi:hypothetical protein